VSKKQQIKQLEAEVEELKAESSEKLKCVIRELEELLDEMREEDS
jgi:hypothetical protein